MRWVLASTLAACGAAINPADKLMEEHELAYRPELVSILPVYENPDFQGGDDTDEVEPRSNPEIELERATARAQQMGGISISNEGEITVDSRAQYEYLLTQANKKVAATMHEVRPSTELGFRVGHIVWWYRDTLQARCELGPGTYHAVGVGSHCIL